MSRTGLRQVGAVAAVLTAVLWSGTGHALPDRNIGVVSASGVRPVMGVTDVPIQRAVGKSFVFLEKAPCDQADGYPAFRTVSGTDGDVGSPGLPYADYAGKELRVESVVPLSCPAGEYDVRFTVVADGSHVQARTMAQAVPDVASVDDMTWARQRWLGRIVFPKRRSIQTYDAATGQYGSLEIRMNEPVRIVDVIWGLSAAKPLWLIVQRDTGEQGFIATAYSWTNHYRDWWTALRPWETALAESNLRYDYRQQNNTGAGPESSLGYGKGNGYIVR